MWGFQSEYGRPSRRHVEEWQDSCKPKENNRRTKEIEDEFEEVVVEKTVYDWNHQGRSATVKEVRVKKRKPPPPPIWSSSGGERQLASCKEPTLLSSRDNSEPLTSTVVEYNHGTGNATSYEENRSVKEEDEIIGGGKRKCADNFMFLPNPFFKVKRQKCLNEGDDIVSEIVFPKTTEAETVVPTTVKTSIVPFPETAEAETVAPTTVKKSIVPFPETVKAETVVPTTVKKSIVPFPETAEAETVAPTTVKKSIVPFPETVKAETVVPTTVKKSIVPFPETAEAEAVAPTTVQTSIVPTTVEKSVPMIVENSVLEASKTVCKNVTSDDIANMSFSSDVSSISNISMLPLEDDDVEILFDGTDSLIFSNVNFNMYRNGKSKIVNVKSEPSNISNADPDDIKIFTDQSYSDNAMSLFNATTNSINTTANEKGSPIQIQEECILSLPSNDSHTNDGKIISNNPVMEESNELKPPLHDNLSSSSSFVYGNVIPTSDKNKKIAALIEDLQMAEKTRNIVFDILKSSQAIYSGSTQFSFPFNAIMPLDVAISRENASC